MGHLRTASQIHDDLRHLGEHIGLTTVYRTLLMMADAGQLALDEQVFLAEAT
jgi:Fe2+ or Zn2+ uptake regulation protein